MSTVETRHALPTGTWNADPVHSDIGFSVEYMAGTFRGTFSRFSAALADGELRGEVDVASIQVKDPNLEAHLQSPEFFDAERHPKLTFVSREVSRSGDEVTIQGDIAIKGHTEQATIRGTIADPSQDPWGNERFGLRLETVVDRTRFGLTWNNPLPSGDPALANDVTISVDLQLVKAA
ncbi:MAG: YceI family protein [Actinomycetota bacterium]|nr:YceI family protein [Actinomycetota bacterium]